LTFPAHYAYLVVANAAFKGLETGMFSSVERTGPPQWHLRTSARHSLAWGICTPHCKIWHLCTFVLNTAA